LYLYRQTIEHMKKRRFLKNSTLLAAGAVLAPVVACKEAPAASEISDGRNADGLFTLPELNFDFDALEPNIDARTMEIHHGKHHAGYVRKFNSALEKSELKGNSLLDILAKVGESDTALRNNGGGHFNHTLFWDNMSPNGGKIPTGDLNDAINAEFGSFKNLKGLFSEAAKTRFGSGWAWLCQDVNKKLFVMSTPNQDNPMMSKVVKKTGTPLLGLDVWEHAYYLNYQNRRGDYIANFFNVIDWDKVGNRLT